MYFPSTPVPSLPSCLKTRWDGMMLKMIYGGGTNLPRFTWKNGCACVCVCVCVCVPCGSSGIQLIDVEVLSLCQVMTQSEWSGPTWSIPCCSTPATPTLSEVSPEAAVLTGRTNVPSRFLFHRLSICTGVRLELCCCKFSRFLANSSVEKCPLL